MAEQDLMDKVVSLAKRRGFVFPGSEIYGGLANSWDYGPLGTELKNNIRDWWWQRFVQSRDDMVGLDAAIIMNPKVWEASGHVGSFSDPLVECKNCHQRFRVDQLVSDEQASPIAKELALKFKKWLEEALPNNQGKADEIGSITGWLKSDIDDDHTFSGRQKEKMVAYAEKAIQEAHDTIDYDVSVNKDGYFEGGSNFYQSFQDRFTEANLKDLAIELFLDSEIKCPNCQKRDWGAPKQFNLLFQTSIGAVEGDKSTVYLRGEIAQAMFVNFKNVLNTTRNRLPFGIASVGKAFRNEITPGNFIFRTLEFDLMEFEYFIREDDWEKTFEYWLAEQRAWLADMGFDTSHLRVREHAKDELSHYSRRTADIEYQTPFGWKEMFGLAYRTDFDLRNHMEKSGQDLQYTDPETNEKFVPHVIEPTFGLTRLLLMTLLEAYTEEVEGDEKRVVLRLKPRLAPYKAAVFPLLRNKPDLVAKAREVYDALRKQHHVAWDDRGNIGKRYLSQDEIGTPWCITVDFQTLEDNSVTMRNRDTKEQARVAVGELGLLISRSLE